MYRIVGGTIYIDHKTKTRNVLVFLCKFHTKYWLQNTIRHIFNLYPKRIRIQSVFHNSLINWIFFYSTGYLPWKQIKSNTIIWSGLLYTVTSVIAMSINWQCQFLSQQFIYDAFGFIWKYTWLDSRSETWQTKIMAYNAE